MEPKYKKDDIIIIRENGVLKKRHIYGDSPQILGDKYKQYLYNVDYNLGLGSEGCVLESNIICIANESHINIPL